MGHVKLTHIFTESFITEKESSVETQKRPLLCACLSNCKCKSEKLARVMIRITFTCLKSQNLLKKLKRNVHLLEFKAGCVIK